MLEVSFVFVFRSAVSVYNFRSGKFKFLCYQRIIEFIYILFPITSACEGRCNFNYK